jgi:hypothetical protein
VALVVAFSLVAQLLTAYDSVGCDGHPSDRGRPGKPGGGSTHQGIASLGSDPPALLTPCSASSKRRTGEVLQAIGGVCLIVGCVMAASGINKQAEGTIPWDPEEQEDG